MKVGQSVEHRKFGPGVVTALDDTFVVIRFGLSQKKFVASVASAYLRDSTQAVREAEPMVIPTQTTARPTLPPIKPFHTPLKRAGLRQRKYPFRADAEQVIQEAYRLLREEKDRKAIQRAVVKLGWTTNMVHKRAARLGLVGKKAPDWSLKEIALLDSYIDLKPEALVEKLREAGFERSLGAVKVKLTRVRLRSRLRQERQGGGTLPTQTMKAKEEVSEPCEEQSSRY